jgi:hypothetical protein
VTVTYQEPKMIKAACGIAFVAVLVIPAFSLAQKLERTKNWEVGDKLIYNLVVHGQSMRLVEEVVQVTNTEIRMTQQVDDQTYEVAHSSSDLSRLKGVCLSRGEGTCEWSPGDLWATFPLEEGKTWSFTMRVTSAGFVTETASVRTVEAVEMLTTPAGQFQAYRVSAHERLVSMSRAGAGPYRGTADFTYWLTSIKGKLVFLKNQYQNSFGEAFTRELVSVELK